MPDPLSIRTNNPGGQWLGDIARQYGATGVQPAAGGNNAAVFPDPVSGAAAQFGLLNQNYVGMPLSAAISKWSGGNNAQNYTDFIAKAAGLPADTVLTHEMLSGPAGIALTKAQARWEAGKDYPLSDEQWGEAQRRVFGGAPVASTGLAPVVGGGGAQATPGAAVGDSGTPDDEFSGSPPVQGMLDPNASAYRMFEKLGGGRGMLNGQQAEPPPQMMRLRNAGGTPMAQQMRQSLLANILKR